MREIAFIKQNKEKWVEIERVVQGKIKKNPDDLSSLYIDLVNDLAFSQTYYPRSKTTIYLNYLSIQIYQKIYKTKRIEENRVKYFFMKEVPTIVYDYRRTLLFAFSIFLLFAAIGVLSAKYDSEYVRIILGDEYVNMALENIEQGNPMGVYGSGSTWGSAIGIIRNNLAVSAKMFIYGVMGGIGTLFALMYNSIMIGSFQYFFAEQGVLGESIMGIWIHGAFEISAIVVTACAGFILGASILFPETYSRLDSFKIGFKKAFKLYLSTVPFIIVAGILEGFVTRYSQEMPWVLNLTIILGCLGFILYYYTIYPFLVISKQRKDAHAV